LDRAIHAGEGLSVFILRSQSRGAKTNWPFFPPLLSDLPPPASRSIFRKTSLPTAGTVAVVAFVRDVAAIMIRYELGHERAVYKGP
jgi:hypothetical protein